MHGIPFRKKKSCVVVRVEQRVITIFIKMEKKESALNFFCSKYIWDLFCFCSNYVYASKPVDCCNREIFIVRYVRTDCTFIKLTLPYYMSLASVQLRKIQFFCTLYICLHLQNITCLITIKVLL